MYEVLSASVSSLDSSTHALYVRLGLHPSGSAITAAAACTLAGEGDAPLAALQDADLIEPMAEDPNAGWRMHALAYGYAVSLAGALDEHERAVAVDRLINHYRDTAYAASLAVNPWGWRLDAQMVERVRAQNRVFTSDAHAMGWFEQQESNLGVVARLAHARRRFEEVVQIADATKMYFASRNSFALWRDVCELGLDAAHAAQDDRARAYMPILRGNLDLARHRFDVARRAFEDALMRWRRLDDLQGQATSLEGLATTYLAKEDDLDQAADLLARSEELHTQIDNRRGAAIMSRKLGATRRKQGLMDEARQRLRTARTKFTQLDDTYQVGRCEHALAATELACDDVEAARHHAVQAIECATRKNATVMLAEVTYLAADIARAAGNTRGERTHLSNALAQFGSYDAPQTSEVAQRLDAMS